jgi:outer membrane protein TolC
VIGWRVVAAAAGLAAAVVTSAAAQDVQVPASEVQTVKAAPPVTLTAPTVSLANAVDLTIRHSAPIQQSNQLVQAAWGRAQETRGFFDYKFTAAPQLTVTLQEMLPFLKSREESKRELISAIANEFTQITTALKALIAGTSTDPPKCPSGFAIGSPDELVLDQFDPKELALLGVGTDIRSIAVIDLKQDIGGFDLSSICTRSNPTLLPPELFADVWRRIDQSGGLGLNGILQSTSQIANEGYGVEAQITQAVAARAKLALDELGPVPQDDLQRTFTVNFDLAKLMRTGLFLDVNFQMQSQEHNFVDKPLDPTFGAFDQPIEFYSSVSGSLTVPLLRGRGTFTADVAERSAKRILESQREQFRQDTSEQVFQTILSYLNVVAAQDTLTLLNESAARQQRLLDLTQGLITAGDVPQVELGRVQARAASVLQSVTQARAAVMDARVSLAQAMGVNLDSVAAAPVPAEKFPTTMAPDPNTAALIPQALTTRHDVKAFAERQTAAGILVSGAKANLRPQVDFTFTGGYSNLYDSPFFKYLPDGQGNIIDTSSPQTLPLSIAGAPRPRTSPVRFWDPRGFYRALTGRYEPYVTASFVLQLPFGNHAAKGRLMQAQSALSAATIDVDDLNRTITQRVIAAAEALRRSAAEIERWQSTAASDEQTLNSMLQRFQIREATLIDTLTTEEALTADRLQLIRQQQIYYSTLARLKFESGALVNFDQPGTPTEIIQFLSAGLAGQ